MLYIVYNKKTLGTAEGKFAHDTQMEHDDCEPIPSQSTSDSLQQTAHFTRSNAPVYDKGRCFFCDLPDKVSNQLRHISYDKSSAALTSAVQLSGNDVWRVRLSEAISPHDSHAVDVLYHVACWAKNVTHVLHKQFS